MIALPSFFSSKRWRSLSVWLLYAVGLTPALWYFYQGAIDNLGADPIKTFEHLLGIWALRFLILTLAITPMRDLLSWNYLRYRRALGLLFFYYVLMHFAVYAVLDQMLIADLILGDILKRPFIMFGMAALVLLIPLAVTSNNISIRKMGRNWGKLHRLIYLIAILGALHFALSTKVLNGEQYIYIGIILALLAYRMARPVLRKRKGRNNPRSSQLSPQN